MWFITAEFNFSSHNCSQSRNHLNRTTNGKNMEQWWTFLGVAGRPKLPQEDIENSSNRSQNIPQQHPQNCRPHLPQFRSVFMTPPWEKDWAKMAAWQSSKRKRWKVWLLHGVNTAFRNRKIIPTVKWLWRGLPDYGVIMWCWICWAPFQWGPIFVCFACWGGEFVMFPWLMLWPCLLWVNPWCLWRCPPPLVLEFLPQTFRAIRSLTSLKELDWCWPTLTSVGGGINLFHFLHPTVGL